MAFDLVTLDKEQIVGFYFDMCKWKNCYRSGIGDGAFVGDLQGITPFEILEGHNLGSVAFKGPFCWVHCRLHCGLYASMQQEDENVEKIKSLEVEERHFFMGTSHVIQLTRSSNNPKNHCVACFYRLLQDLETMINTCLYKVLYLQIKCGVSKSRIHHLYVEAINQRKIRLNSNEYEINKS